MWAGLRNLPYFWWDRLVASDAGLVRLTFAVRVTASVALTFAAIEALTTVTALPKTMIVMGVIESLFGSVAVRDPSPSSQRLSLLLTPVSAAAALTLGTALSPWRAAGDGVFLVVIFAAVYARRFGPRATALGMLAYISYFLGIFLHLPLSQLPYQMLALAIGAAASYVVRFLVFRDRPERTLRRVLDSFYRRVQQMLGEIDAALAAGVWDGPFRKRLRRRVGQINETALTAEGQIEALDPGRLKPASRRSEMGLRLFDVEVAAGRLADAAVHSMPPPGARAALRLRLDELRKALNDTSGPNRHTRFDTQPRTDYGSGDDEGPALNAIDGLIEALRAMPNTDSVPKSAASAKSPGAKSPAVAARSGILPSTRAAIQVTVACALAIIPGEFLSTRRWYWAVITVFVMYTGTQSRGDVFDKGIQRVIGTLAGVGAGILIATAVSGRYTISLGLILGCVFLGFYLLRVSYGLMIFWITIMISLLYGLMGLFTPSLLVLRIEETVIGAVVAVAVAMFLLPASSRARFRTASRAYLQTLRVLVGRVGQSQTTATSQGEDLTELARELDRRFHQLEAAGKPLTGVLSGALAPTDARRWVRVFQVCDYYARELAGPGQLSRISDGQAAESGLLAARIDAGIGTMLDLLEKGRGKAAVLRKNDSHRAYASTANGRERGPGRSALDGRMAALIRIDEAIRRLALDSGAAGDGLVDKAKPEIQNSRREH